MRRYLLLFFLAVFIIPQLSAQKTKINLSPEKYQLEVLTKSKSGLTLKAQLPELNLMQTEVKGETFAKLNVPGMIKIFEEGMPGIPVISRLIEVPQNAKVKFEIIGYDEEIIKLAEHGVDAKIYPAQASQSKSEDKPPFAIKEGVYNTDDYIGKKIAVFQESGQMRASRLGRVQLNVIDYNPVKNILKVRNKLIVKISFEDADYQKTKALKKKYSSPYYNSFLKPYILNFDNEASKELITQEPVHFVIVSDRMFEAQLAPYIAWKELKGFKVTTAYTDDIGSTTTAIKSYLQNIYEGSNPMSFVLFVGDVAQIPAWDGESAGHVTDLRYCEYTGDDLPEVYYGRFSAQNTNQLQPQIDKTLMYEKYEMTDPSYLSEFLLVAGDDETWEDIHGNGAIWYADNYYANSDNGINAHTYLQDPPNGNGWVHDEIITNVNAGVALANYTAHCSSDGWAEPGFSVSDVSGLSNSEKYGVWIGNCCLSVKFDDDECFGEAALRKANGGAIGDIGGSNSTYWDEDYWWGIGLGEPVEEPNYNDFGLGAYDGAFHTLTNEVSDLDSWYITQSQMNQCGNLAIEASTSSRKQYYWEIYHLMGDPTLMPYLGVPDAMTVTPSPSALMLGMTQLSVTSAPYSYVALSQSGTLIDVALSDASGNATLNFASDALSVGDADLVVTAQNKQPYIGTISVSPADEPYVVLESYTTDITPEYNQTVAINTTLENVAETGSGYSANDVSATLSITDPYVTITDNSADYGSIAAGGTAGIEAAYEISIADNIPNAYVLEFTLTITGEDGSGNPYTWTSPLNITVNAPELVPGTYTITNDDNADGILDPGETADINIALSNSGDADVSNVIGQISSSFTDWTINNTSTSPVSLAAGQSADFTFNVSVNASVAPGTEAAFDFNATAGANDQYTANNSHTVIIGFVPEYCESGATSDGDSNIEQVNLGDIATNTTGECAGYTDFTDDPTATTDLVIGVTYDMSVFFGNCDAGSYTKAGKVYIDWNYDGDFEDAGETVHESPAVDDNWLEEFSLTVSADVNPGPKFMRIVVSEDESNINPCGTYNFGETEDYKINLVAPEAPQADFSADQTTVTQGGIVSFTDLTENYPSQWEWTISPGTAGTDYEFFGGTDASSQNPQVKFLADGAYTVELTASNLTGDDTETKTDYITVNPTTEAPVADFEANATDVLSGGIVSFTDLSTNMPTSWTWTISPQTGISFVNGTDANSQNPQVQFDTDGLYTVELVAGNEFGDSDPAVMTDYIEVTSEITIGDGNLGSGNYPFYNYFENNKTQIIYEAENFGAQKDLTSLAFDFSYVTSVASDRELTDLSIKLSHTTMSEFSGTYGDNTDATEVFFAASYTLPGETGWHVFDIDDFTYNGTDNLMVEILWGDNGYYCGSDDYYKLNSTDAGLNVVSYGIADSETPPIWDAVSNIRPNIAFEYAEAPVSAENPIAEGNIKLFPNPTDEQFTLVCNESGSTIELYSISGQLIKRIDHAEKQTQINLSSQAPGIYLVKVLQEEKTYNLKVVLK